MRRAQLLAESVAVCCPSCGEAQPNRNDGSEQWLTEDFQRLTDTRATCVSCEAKFLIFSDSKVMFR
jgi:hypothetical protein